MRKIFKRLSMLCLGFAMIVLSGCAGAVPWNKQNYAGIEEWSVDYNDGAIERVHYINGKEASGSQIKIHLSDGTILNFYGNDIKAFEGQGMRAAVEKALAEQLGEVAPGVIESVLKAIKGGVP